VEFIAKSGRLDTILQKHLSQSRNQIERFIKQGNVKVDGQIIKKCGYKLKGGEIVFYEIQEMTERKTVDVDFDVDILYEDEHLLVVNKPPFLTVHPAPSVKEPTLVDWLKTKNISLSTISGDERHGIVHRIDKQTSGALVVAKTNEAHKGLSKQLEDKSMGRYYLALTDLPLKENIVVEKKIARNRKNRLKMGVDEKGKEAKTAFIKLLLSKNEKNELLLCKLYTGRTHQIRVHLKSLSRHILGDDLYGFKSKEGKIKRVMLHAYIIYFTHPISGEKMLIKAPLFDDFLEVAKKLFDKEKFDEKIDTKYILGAVDTVC